MSVGADVCPSKLESCSTNQFSPTGLIYRGNIANVLVLAMWMASLQDCRDPKEEMNSEPGMRKARRSLSSLSQI